MARLAGQCAPARRAVLITSFNPDQVSSTAHTFTSTKPSGSAISRIRSSVTVVTTPEAFFGHDTQTAASGRIVDTRRASRSGQLAAIGDEQVHDVGIPVVALHELHVRRQRGEEGLVVAGRADGDDGSSFGDPELLRERSSGITGGHDALNGGRQRF
ncbi:MAG TPA: hypothetical protein VH417_04235 [Vicinamibacterales bacterium]